MKKIHSTVDRICDGFIKFVLRLLRWEGRDFSYRQVRSRYPLLRHFILEVPNYLLAFAGSYFSFRPSALVVEPLNSCNLSCIECSVNRGMKRPRGTMEFDLFKKAVDENPFMIRANLTHCGEPLLHQDILKMIAYLHGKKKACTIFTNATLLDDELMTGLIDSGLDVITFSVDGVGEAYEKVRGWKYDDVEKKIARFLQINEEKGNPVWTEINMVDFAATAGQWPKVLEAWQGRVNAVMKTPIAGSGRRRRRCFVLWRGLTVLWDGTVVPCCVDREAEMKLGNIRENNLSEIFNGVAMRELRKKHARGEFPRICAACDEFFG